MKDYKQEYEQHYYKKKMDEVNAEKRDGCFSKVFVIIFIIVLIIYGLSNS